MKASVTQLTKLKLKPTARPMFFAILESVMLANGLSAPQHSTYLVIFEDGRDRVGGPPGVAVHQKARFNKEKLNIMDGTGEITDATG